MSGEGDQMGVVIAPETAEEANHVASALRAGGFQPVIDHSAAADRLGAFPVLVPPGELAEAKGFLRGLRAAQLRAPVPAMAAPAPPVAAAALASAPRALDRLLPAAGRALALLTGLLVVVGGVAALTSMLQFLNALRDH